MELFERIETIKTDKGDIVIFTLQNRNSEFALETQSLHQKPDKLALQMNENEREEITNRALEYIKERMPNAKVTTAKVMLGSILLFSIPFQQAEAHVETSQILPTVSYASHRVTSGDTIWTISVQYGIPMSELLLKNNLTMESKLSIGQKLTIPIHHVPAKSVVSPNHGELLNWWTEAQYVFTIGKTAKVIDFQTGKVFYVKRTIGANHADCEPLTAKDASVIKEVWGGSYSWKLRPVLVEVDGRKIAASMASMPHGVEYIKENQFTGHFDIHFLESTRHKDGLIDWKHQQNIKISAGLQSL